jgi:hypothetical protein
VCSDYGFVPTLEVEVKLTVSDPQKLSHSFANCPEITVHLPLTQLISIKKGETDYYALLDRRNYCRSKNNGQKRVGDNQLGATGTLAPERRRSRCPLFA